MSFDFIIYFCYVLIHNSRFHKYTFYGRGSEWRFKRKNNALSKLAAHANEYLTGADTTTRVYLLQTVEQANRHFAEMIKNTPLPEGLDDETLVQVRENLAQMATPYIESASKYENLKQEQITNLALENKQEVIAQLRTEVTNYSSFIINEERPFVASTFSAEELNKITRPLKSGVEDKKSLSLAQNYFANLGNQRLAAYFKGRMESLGEVQ